MKLGISLPLVDIHGDPATVRDFAQTAEGMGYRHLAAPDHVLGVNVASRPDWGQRNTSKDFFHDPFVLFGFLAGCTQKIDFSTQVLILAQRQTVLVAKQAASPRRAVRRALPARHRRRLERGRVRRPQREFFTTAAAARRSRSASCRRCGPSRTSPSRANGTRSRMPASTRCRPTARVPVWFGGHADVTLRRIANMGDGWMMLAHAMGAEAETAFAALRGYVEKEGRDFSTIGLEVWVSTGNGGPDDWRKECLYWKSVGVTHVTVNSTYARGPHKRIAGRTVAAHLEAMKQYHDAVKDLL